MISARSRLATAAAAALAGVLASAAFAFAAGGPTFSDVPPGSTFSAEIEAIAQAGITTGFPDGTYRPSGTVTRGAMAAFMGRGFGRAGYDEGTVVGTDETTPIPALAEVTMAAGASGAGTEGFVVVQGTVVGYFPPECPCSLSAAVVDASSGNQYPVRIQSVLDAGANVQTSVAAQAWVPITGGTSKTFQLKVTASLAGAGGAAVSGDLIATYFPFDATGNAPGG